MACLHTLNLDANELKLLGLLSGKSWEELREEVSWAGQAEVTAGEPAADEEVRQGQCGYYSFRFSAELPFKRNFSPLFRSSVSSI